MRSTERSSVSVLVKHRYFSSAASIEYVPVSNTNSSDFFSDESLLEQDAISGAAASAARIEKRFMFELPERGGDACLACKIAAFVRTSSGRDPVSGRLNFGRRGCRWGPSQVKPLAFSTGAQAA